MSAADTCMKTATKIRDLPGFVGHATLYRLSQPIRHERWSKGGFKPEQYDYVVVSAASMMFTGPETYIFGADSSGKILDWIELDGSYRGGLSHAEALERAGYAIT